MMPSSVLADKAAAAHAEAVRALEEVLQQPEDIMKLPSLIQEYSQKLESNKMQMSEAVVSATASARGSMDAMGRSQSVLQQMRKCFVDIDNLCTECLSLIEQQDKIALLSMAHVNLASTQSDARAIKNLPDDAAFARELLQRPSRLVEAYESVIRLEVAHDSVQKAMQKQLSTQADDSNLMQYFDAVTDISEAFESKMMGMFWNLPDVARATPALLVQGAQIMAVQRLVEQQSKAAPARQYQERCMSAMEDGVKQRFRPLFEACYDLWDALGGMEPRSPGEEPASRAAPAGHGVAEEGCAKVLHMADGLAGELQCVYDFVEPCFSPKDGVFPATFAVYHRQFAQMLDVLGDRAGSMATVELLLIMEWVTNYQESIIDMVVDHELAEFPDAAVAVLPSGVKPDARGLDMISMHYIQRMHATVKQWYNNMIEADFSLGVKVNDEGQWWTPGVVDFFRVLHDQTDTVETVTRGNMLLDTANAALDIMREYQAALKERLAGEMSLELAAAMVNNMVMCYNEADSFARHIEDVVSVEYQGMLDAEEPCAGFIDVGKAACDKLVEAVISDPGYERLFTSLYAEGGKEGESMAAIIATTNDYLTNPADGLESKLDAGWFKRTSEGLLAKIVAACVRRLLKSVPNPVTKSFVRQAQTGAEQLQVAFERHRLKPEKVEAHVAVLGNVIELLRADADGFVFAYSYVVKADHTVGPPVLEKILERRTDLDKADKADVMSQCRDLHAARLKDLEMAPSGIGQRLLGPIFGLANKGMKSVTPGPTP